MVNKKIISPRRNLAAYKYVLYIFKNVFVPLLKLGLSVLLVKLKILLKLILIKEVKSNPCSIYL